MILSRRKEKDFGLTRRFPCFFSETMQSFRLFFCDHVFPYLVFLFSSKMKWQNSLKQKSNNKNGFIVLCLSKEKVKSFQIQASKRVVLSKQEIVPTQTILVWALFQKETKQRNLFATKIILPERFLASTKTHIEPFFFVAFLPQRH